MLIAGSFLKIETDKEKIDKLNDVTDQIHFDIMDGIFTENKTLKLSIMKEKLKDITKPMDIHLMVFDVKKYVDDILNFNPRYITFHIEVGDSIKELIDYIKSKNVKVGIAINPDTELEKITPFLDTLDLVLIMSVPAGKGGQKFIDISDRLKYIKEYRENNNLSYLVEVDGGINKETIKKVKDADIAVCGSFITDSDDYLKTVSLLRGEIDE